MFSYDEVIELLNELKLEHSEANIKWAYEILIKETKLDVKIRKYENDYEEDFFNYDDEYECDEDCECDDENDNDCCGNCGCGM